MYNHIIQFNNKINELKGTIFYIQEIYDEYDKDMLDVITNASLVYDNQ